MFLHHVNVDNPTRRAIIHVQGCMYVADLDLSSAVRRRTTIAISAFDRVPLRVALNSYRFAVPWLWSPDISSVYR